MWSTCEEESPGTGLYRLEAQRWGYETGQMNVKMGDGGSQGLGVSAYAGGWMTFIGS